VANFDATVKDELAATDPGVSVTTAASDLPAVVMDAAAQAELIKAVYDAPQGVWAMADYPPGLVETSGNLGVLEIAAGQFTAGAKVRSADDAERDAHAQRYVDVFAAVGGATYLDGEYGAWPPNPDSPLLALMQQVYLDTFGTAPEVAAIHAGLETSVAGEKYPGMDMISVGATIEYLHSYKEHVEVASVAKLYELLVATLGAIE
jgi:dipeptidase D